MPEHTFKYGPELRHTHNLCIRSPRSVSLMALQHNVTYVLLLIAVGSCMATVGMFGATEVELSNLTSSKGTAEEVGEAVGFVSILEPGVPIEEYSQLPKLLKPRLESEGITASVGLVETPYFVSKLPLYFLVRNVRRALNQIREHSDKARIYMCFHGSWASTKAGKVVASLGTAVDGLIFLGGMAPVRTETRQLVLSGELDLQLLMGHVAVAHDAATEAHGSRSVAVMSGMNHRMVTLARSLPYADLDGRGSFEEAAQRVCSSLARWVLHGSLDGGVASWTEEYLKPLKEALSMEGHGSISDVAHGRRSEWTERCQADLATNDEVEIQASVRDVIHSPSATPVPIPQISGKCPSSRRQSAVCLEMSTVTWPRYPGGESDLSQPAATQDFIAKFNSREAILHAAGLNITFDQADGSDHICAKLNSNAFEEAKRMAPVAVASRFKDVGLKPQFLSDIGPYLINPLWMATPLRFEVKASGGTEALFISSPMMRTSSKFVIPSLRGLHYCKLLSPARALEWIYLEGLRNKVTR